MSDIERPYLAFDATFMPCREEGSQALVTAITINSDGVREFVAERVVDTESYDSWSSFMEDLKARGLHGVKLVISDAHPGLKKAIRHKFIVANGKDT